MGKFKDYTGEKFGRLECISLSEPATVNGKTYWKCKCDCGNIVDLNIRNVVDKGLNSCGCIKKTSKDYTGQKFGSLECMHFVETVNGITYWKCKCNCGNIVDLNIKNVVYRGVGSCGCIKKTSNDYTGQKFGRLECMHFVETVNGETYWKCQCDCGNIVDLNIRDVVYGCVGSCGCIKKTFKDYTGQKFGNLECISFVERVNNKIYWKFQCDCGKIVDLNIRNVIHGSVSSCGCIKKTFKDYTGQKFGRLECISFVEKVNNTTYWKFKCDCGKIVDLNIGSVLYGGIKSCGCIRNIGQDYKGQKFGDLKCISPSKPAIVNGKNYWECKCTCGKIVDVNIESLISGSKKSCGCLKEKRPPFKDYTGRKFGRLECMHFVEKVNGLTYWKLKCDCGNIVDLSIFSVVSGNKKSCGCLGNSGQDYTGKKFGRLECIAPSEPSKANGKAYWQCKCNCGNIIDINIHSLVSGGTKSCGCLKKSGDYTGQKFGRLECLSPSDPERVNGRIFWKCKCDCGNIIDVYIRSVVSGVKKSCGCLRNSGKLRV